MYSRIIFQVAFPFLLLGLLSISSCKDDDIPPVDIKCKFSVLGEMDAVRIAGFLVRNEDAVYYLNHSNDSLIITTVGEDSVITTISVYAPDIGIRLLLNDLVVHKGDWVSIPIGAIEYFVNLKTGVLRTSYREPLFGEDNNYFSLDDDGICYHLMNNAASQTSTIVKWDLVTDTRAFVDSSRRKGDGIPKYLGKSVVDNAHYLIRSNYLPGTTSGSIYTYSIVKISENGQQIEVRIDSTTDYNHYELSFGMDEKNLYFSINNIMYCYHWETMTLNWARALSKLQTDKILVVDGRLIYKNDNTIYCLDVQNGNVFWEIEDSRVIDYKVFNNQIFVLSGFENNNSLMNIYSLSNKEVVGSFMSSDYNGSRNVSQFLSYSVSDKGEIYLMDKNKYLTLKMECP